jgi:hypothetical protein
MEEMELHIHSVEAKFWREAYIAALRTGYTEPAAQADEALLELMSRFPAPEPEAWPTVGHMYQAAGQQQNQDMQFFALEDSQPLRAEGAHPEAGDYLIGSGSDTSNLEAVLGKGPSIEVGDAPAHQVLVADLTAHMALVPKSSEPEVDDAPVPGEDELG